MGTYRASRNNNDVVREEEKSEKEQKKESTAKAVDVGLETGLDIYTAGAFSKVKNTVTSVPIVGKMAQKKWDKSVNKAAGMLSKTPIGDIAKKADDVGITDTARGVKDAYNMASGQISSNNSTTNTNNSSNKSNILNNLSKLKGKSNNKSSLFGSGSFKANNLLSFKMKLIIVGSFAGFLLFIMIFMTVFAEPDDVNMGLTNNTELSSKGGMVTEEEIANKLVYLNDTDLGNSELNKDSIYVITITDLETVDEGINTIKNIMSEYNFYIKPTGNTEVDTKLKNEFQDKVLENVDSPLNEIYSKIYLNSGNISGEVGEAAKISKGDRMKYLFPDGTPNSESQMSKYLTTITVPACKQDGSVRNIKITLHKNIASEVEAVFNELAAIKFPVKDAYAYSWRQQASGTGSRSHHSYGVAIDLNANDNPAVYWGRSPDKSSAFYNNDRVVAIWKNHGFYWGGDWSKKYYDPMHFSYTNH